MVKGEFDQYNRPMVRSEVALTGVGVAHPVRFLMDTGSVDTILMPVDSQKFRLHPMGLPAPRPIRGLGGAIDGYPLAAEISFAGGGILYIYRMNILVVLAGPATPSRPSLLGSEVLARWKFTIHKLAGDVLIDPISKDDTIP